MWRLSPCPTKQSPDVRTKLTRGADVLRSMYDSEPVNVPLMYESGTHDPVKPNVALALVYFPYNQPPPVPSQAARATTATIMSANRRTASIGLNPPRCIVGQDLPRLPVIVPTRGGGRPSVLEPGDRAW